MWCFIVAVWLMTCFRCCAVINQEGWVCCGYVLLKFPPRTFVWHSPAVAQQIQPLHLYNYSTFMMIHGLCGHFGDITFYTAVDGN